MMRRRHRGVTLIELMVVLVVIGVFAAVAVPSFSDQMGRRRLEGAANELVTDLTFARAKCLSANAAVTLATNSLGKQYTITNVSTNEIYKTVALDSRLTLTSSVSVAYTPLRGFAAADSAITFSSSGTPAQLRVSTTAVGKVSVCSPGGGFPGYMSC